MAKKQKSFSKGDTYKRLWCENCDCFLTETHISDTEDKVIKCKDCGAINRIISPPYVGELDGKMGVYFGAKSDSTFTAVPEPILEDLFKDQIIN